MVRNRHAVLDCDFITKLKHEALEQGVSMLELSRRLAKLDEPFKKVYRKQNEKKNSYWIKI